MKTVRQGIEARSISRTNWISNIIGVASGVLVCMLTSSSVLATQFRFTKIVDTNTPIPDSTRNFISFENPAVDRGHVAFSSGGGIYKIVNNLLILIGGGTGSTLSLDGGNVAFNTGYYTYPPVIYTWIDSSVIPAVSRNTSAILGNISISSFESFAQPSYDNGLLAFRASYRRSNSALALQSIVTNVDGGFKVVAEYYPRSLSPCFGTPAKDFTALGYPVLSNGVVVFRGVNYCPGRSLENLIPDVILKTNGGSLQVLVDTRTSIPNGTGNFTSFGNYGYDNGNLAFRGIGNEEQGIYTIIDGVLGVVADLNTTIPGGENRFTSFSDVAIDGYNVAFVGSYPEGLGLYINIGNTITPIVKSGETLDHKIVNSISIGREAISGHQIAFQARFSDGSSGIYVATKEPVSESD